MRHERSCRRAASRDGDVELPSAVGNLRHDQEITGIAQPFNDREFLA
jgi:hypothetical protein